MDAASIYAMSPGDVKWGVAFIIFLAAVFVWGTVTSFLKFRRTGEKKELLGVFFCGAFAIGMIPADMVLRSHTSAATVRRRGAPPQGVPIGEAGAETRRERLPGAAWSTRPRPASPPRQRATRAYGRDGARCACGWHLRGAGA